MFYNKYLYNKLLTAVSAAGSRQRVGIVSGQLSDVGVDITKYIPCGHLPSYSL